MNVKETVDKLQKKIDAKYKDFSAFQLVYSVENYNEIIDLKLYLSHTWLKVCLWDSDSDNREFYDDKNEYEPFEKYLQRTIDEIIDSFKELKKLIK